MIIKNLEYKEKAVTKLIDLAKESLNRNGSETVVFKAPTGAGKTIMMAEFISRIAEVKEKPAVSFIWAAPRKLHLQSKEKIEDYFSSSRIAECSTVDELNGNQIEENEILFLNWESINKAGNVLLRENESDFNLTAIIKNTLFAGREIILIIDESHHTATAENTRGLIDIMSPKVTIEVSATPHLSSDNIVKVRFEEVVGEGMIKKRVALNPNLKAPKLESEGSDLYILREALEKRNYLKKKLEKAGTNVNPLLLIQLPDTNSADFVNKTDEIEELLAKHFKTTTENGKLAVYLSEDKRNLENISINDNEVEVLLFKQAIALGWDCPRAYILVLFREWHSEKFSIQTVGRIMRMPETKHYESEELNIGYVYTNIANNNIKIEEELARDYFTIYTGLRIDKYKNIDLTSYHTFRQRELTRLAPSFIPLFTKHAKDYNLSARINTSVHNVTDTIPIDGEIHVELVGSDKDAVTVLGDLTLAKSTTELELAFKYYVREALSTNGLHPEKRSIGRVCHGIYHFFAQELRMPFEQQQREIMTIVLHHENIQAFTDVMNLAISGYMEKHPKHPTKSVENDEFWNVPASLDYNANNEERKPAFKRSVIQPYYESTLSNKKWQTEKDFTAFLDGSQEVDWWFRNGDRDSTFFAVPYKSGGSEQSFYVDFVVKLNDGRIGLFDTKSGWTAKDAADRSDGLQHYIQKQNQNGKKLFGGIVCPKNKSFFIFSKTPYHFDEELRGWDILTFKS